MTLLAWLIFVAAGTLEVSGDAFIRKGLRGSHVLFILTGAALLGCYGMVVNLVRWDFSKLLGVYIAIFALVSVLTGRYYFKEAIPFATWFGLGLILAGGLVIQFGSK